jgi:hypothetical protein
VTCAVLHCRRSLYAYQDIKDATAVVPQHKELAETAIDDLLSLSAASPV